MSVEHLVSYGTAGSVGRFAAPAPGLAARGDRVVVRTERGLEIGTVLAADTPAGPRYLADVPVGEFVRRATPEDDARQHECDALGRAVLEAADCRATDAILSVSFLEAEVPLDGGACTLHALPWGPCDLDGLLAELSAEWGVAVRLLDVSRTPVVKEPAGCGQPGCGSGGSCGSGCSGGGCSRGSVKSAGELTAYFADLRRKMEDAGMVRKSLL